MQPDGLFFTPVDLVERYQGKITLRTLANWRSTGTSPPYTKIGGRILYPKEKLFEWEQSRTVQGTFQYKK
jgi:hypothetical protein